MRELKFRAWDKAQLVMVYKNENDDAGYWDGVYCSNVEMLNARLKDNSYEWMQYTGLKDKNGKEVYESDIVQDKNGKKYLIKWGINSNGFIAKTNEVHGNVYSSYHLTPKTEVIGNIFENPELLK